MPVYTLDTLTSAVAVDLRTESDEAQDALSARVGTDSVVVRPDLRFTIFYASTATHMLESRSDGRGNYWHRINREVFATAADIPANYRKLGAIARAVETADSLTLAALEARYVADLALTARNEYRDDKTRADALALLNAALLDGIGSQPI